MNLVREPDAGNPPVRFDEREVETEHGMRLVRHRRGNPDPEYAEAYPTAPPLDSTWNSPNVKDHSTRRYSYSTRHGQRLSQTAYLVNIGPVPLSLPAFASSI